MKQACEIRTYGDDRFHYTAGYFPDNKWLDNDTLILERAVHPSIGCNDFEGKAGEIELVRLDLRDDRTEVVCRDRIFGYHYLVHGNRIYYTDRQALHVLDLATGANTILYRNEDYHAGEPTAALCGPSITLDGKAICVHVVGADITTRAIVLDTATGRVRYSFDVPFSRPFSQASHVMICPTDADLVYFCHEGTTEYISNRMWLYDARSRKAWCCARQRLDENGNLGDCFGHEMWAPDGKGMYFVKYAQSPLRPAGICYVDTESCNPQVLYSGFRYWHVGVSADGSCLMADTQHGPWAKGMSEVVVVDLADHTETLIDTARSTNHPNHPHPQLSPDASRLIYTSLDERGRSVMKAAFLETK